MACAISSTASAATRATALQSIPFDYQRQMRVFTRRKCRAFARDAYEKALEHWIRHFISMTRARRSSFHSYQTMQSSRHAGLVLSQRENHLPVQGGAMPRHRLLQRFKEDRDSVLFGTDSFWQGVDVPGERLSNVISPRLRLPFRSPAHPGEVRAIIEQAASLPRVLAARGAAEVPAGRGRLIRTQQDKGSWSSSTRTDQALRQGLPRRLPKCPVKVVE